MFWAAGTLATQGEQMPRQWLARVVSVLWMFTAVVFVAFYTAQLTATLTVPMTCPATSFEVVVTNAAGTTARATLCVDASDLFPPLAVANLLRTARLIMRGEVMVPAALLT